MPIDILSIDIGGTHGKIRVPNDSQKRELSERQRPTDFMNHAISSVSDEFVY